MLGEMSLVNTDFSLSIVGEYDRDPYSGLRRRSIREKEGGKIIKRISVRLINGKRI